MKYLRTAIFWFNFGFFTTAFYLLLLPIVLVHKLFARDTLSVTAHWIATLWGKTLMALSPGWHTSIKGREHLPKHGKDRPVVIVANHQSGADIWALYLTGAQFRWLSKREVFQIPLIGSAMRWAGYVPIQRGNPGSHSSALQVSSQWIKKGISMAFFPEGTRSEDGSLKEFKSGAFRLAVENGVAIQPIVIRGTCHMMRKKSIMPNPAKIEVEILPALFPMEKELVSDFTIRVHDLIKSRLQQ